MSTAPQTLPADFFSKQQAQTPPDTLPANFDFSKSPEQQESEKPGFWKTLGSDLKGLLTPSAQNPYPGMGQEQKVQAAAQSSREDQSRKAAGYSGTYRAIAPVAQSLGVNVTGMEQSAAQGDAAGVLGHAVAGAAPFVAGPVAEALIKRGAPAVQSGMQGAAERMYQSALKPSTTLGAEKIGKVVNTGLDANVPVSEQGAIKLSGLISDLQQRVKDQISSNPSATVNKFAVTSRLSDTAKKFSNQVNPSADLDAISNSGQEFLNNQNAKIPAVDAQLLKQGTYQQLKSRAYGELKGASIEAQKALARGIKEELETQFPELKGLNAQEAKFFGLDSALEKALDRIKNRDIVGLSTPALGGAVGVATHSGPAAAAAFILKAAIDNPAVKSRLAIALSKGSKGSVGPSASIAKISAYSAALANAANSSESDSRSNQIQP